MSEELHGRVIQSDIFPLVPSLGWRDTPQVESLPFFFLNGIPSTFTLWASRFFWTPSLFVDPPQQGDPESPKRCGFSCVNLPWVTHMRQVNSNGFAHIPFDSLALGNSCDSPPQPFSPSPNGIIRLPPKVLPPVFMSCFPLLYFPITSLPVPGLNPLFDLSSPPALGSSLL